MINHRLHIDLLMPENIRKIWLLLLTQAQRLEGILHQVRASEFSMDEVLNKMLEPQQHDPSDRRHLDTAMHLACRKGDVVIVRCLMAAGAHSDILGAARVTVEHEALQLEKSNPNAYQFRQIRELLAEPMPRCPPGHRSGPVEICVALSVLSVDASLVHRVRVFMYARNFLH